MDELFGLSMNAIMLVLLGVLGLALASVAYVILRSRVMFKMGLRNIPRRPAQTILIILGLMLSTLIISAAFTTGDTVDHSLTAQAYSLLGHTDQWVQREGEGESAPGDIDSTIEADVIEQARQAVTGDPNVDGFLPMLFEQIPAVNARSRQSEPAVNLAGVDTTSLEGFPDVVSTSSGDVLDVSTLGDDEVFMNESAAEDLAAEPGDSITVYIQGEAHEFAVVEIVEDTLMSGVGDFESRQGMVTRLDRVQELFEQPGQASFIAISHTGDEREGLALTDQVLASLSPEVQAFGLEFYDVKNDLVTGFEEAGNFMTTFFLIFGLFSIAAGMLLIVMIFVMLAAERKPELGMARAVGTKRGHLVQMFMSEGMAYNLLAAAVGAALGVGVAFFIANIMAQIFGDFFDIEPTFTVRSIVISYALGVSLTFVTVTFSSWRASNLNIVAAIRDLPDNVPVNEESGRLPGFLRGVLNAAVLITLFPVAVFVYLLRGHQFSFRREERTAQERIPIWPFIVFPLAPFYLVALGIVWAVRDRRPSNLPMWVIVLGILLPVLGIVLVAMQDRDRPIPWRVGFGLMGIVIGALLMVMGLSGDVAFPFALGFTFVTFGIAICIEYFGVPARPVYTFAGLFLVVLWGLTAGQRLEFLFGDLAGDIEMFFLSGIAMVASATMIIIYNADLVLLGLSRLGGILGGILPATKTAVAYPLANRFRTGMTLAMISLVIFALTMMSTMNYNFDRLFLADEARGGWDITVDENPNNPIDDLQATLATNGSTVGQSFRAVGKVGFAGESDVSMAGENDFSDYLILGTDAGFLEGSSIPLSARATGLETDQDVWQQLSTRDDVAIVDRFTVEEGGFTFGEFSFHIDGIGAEDEVFEPVLITIRDPITGTQRDVEVIGVIDFGASSPFFGIFVPEQAFMDTFGPPLLSRHYVGLEDPDEAQDAAREIEGALLATGAQAESIKERIEDEQALSRNFFRLMQGFMGLGLFVGIAAVGVIAFRTVVERRQQIGMLRAIGYKRNMVALSFVMESSFVTLLGILSGVALAVWLSYFLLTSDDFPESSTGYVVPWLQIVFIGTLAFVASLIMTFIPSRQAASIPTAEALRYE
jgi:ABC-type lipoprotein release transport system permease subunit